MRVLTLLLATAFTTGAVLAQEVNGIGYSNVADALKALKARKDVAFTSQSGWAVADDRASGTVWAFTPPYHAAYPAVVKRTVVSRNGAAGMETKSLCRAGKSVCDKLIDEFNALQVKSSQDLPVLTTMPKPVPPSTIELELMPGDAYLLTLKSYRSATWEAGQQELLPKAKEACGDSEPSFGAYRFETSEAVTGPTAGQRLLVLKQNIRCGGVMAAPVEDSQAPKAAASDEPWKATPEQIKRVENQTKVYLALKDAGKYASAHAMHDAKLRAVTPLDRWQFDQQTFAKKAGGALQRSVRKVIWFQNPPKAAPGIYAAVDYSSRFANINIHCGNIVWHELADGSFEMVREEQNAIDKQTEKRVSPADLAKMRERIGCK